MPAIWNINKGYDVNNKKVSSKLTFEVGEKFNGRIVDKAEGNEVLVKLADGWQFTAEIDGEFNVENQGLIKFAVEGFENGKLKLKIVQGEKKESNSTGDSLLNLMEKEGLPKADMELLLAMTKHNLPLTKENIVYIKSIIQFSEKINKSLEEIDDFIGKFIAGKGIDPQSTEAKEIQNVLKDFFNSFKKMSNEDILLFLENDIDLNKENIQSYNKLFKGDNTLKEYFDSVGNELNLLKEESQVTQNIKEPLKNILLGRASSFNVTSYNEALSKLEDITDTTVLEMVKENSVDKKEFTKETLNKVVSNILNRNIYLSDSEFEQTTNMLRVISNDNVEENILMEVTQKINTAIIKEPLKNILSDRVSSFNSTNYSEALSKVDNITDNLFLKIVKGNSIDQTEFTKDTLNKVVSNIFNSDINLTDAEFEQTTKLIRTILEDNVNENRLEGSKFENKNIDELTSKKAEPQLNNDSQIASKIYDSNETAKSKINIMTLLKSMMKTDTAIVKEPLKNILSERVSSFNFTSYNEALSKLDEITDNTFLEMVMENSINKTEFTKDTLNKVVSKIFNTDINLSDSEFEQTTDMLRLILEDNVEKNGIDGRKVNNKTLDELNLKATEPQLNKELQKGIPDEEKLNLKSDIRTQEQKYSNEVMNLRELLDKGEGINSKDLIKNEIKVKLEEMKEVIKELIKVSDNESLKNSKIMELIKGNMNDFKLFNSISNEYYYLDIPIKQNNNEYPCKLIIKDNRKDGKKIDRSNIKMVVSVKTINLGSIDGYLKVRDSNLDIDLKCDDKYMKIIDKDKEKLINTLKTLGFFVNVIVTKKNKDVDITTCRDFFDDSNTRAIDTTV